MLKAKLIMAAVKIIMAATALGVGIWYLSSSLGGSAMTYTSMDNFLSSIGVENGDIASANGCFMCRYISDLFAVIGDATHRFWDIMVDSIWVLVVLGFGVFVLIHTIQYMYNNAKKTATLDAKEYKIEFKEWFDKVWKQGIRILFVGVLIGALGLGGTTALRTVSQLTITPVLYVGSELAMAATGVSDAAQCNALTAVGETESTDILNPIMRPFMCVMGNLNSVMLAGAAGGFALMNYAWLDMGGGVFTWLAGLTLVLMFLIVGFDLFFQVLSVVFKLVFIIIFLPLLLAATAFEGVWAKANSLVSNAIGMLISSAVRIVAISLKVVILYATVSYAADMYFPAPADGYTAILPPMMGMQADNPDAQTLSVMNVFSECESVSMTSDGLDKDLFKNCFTARRAAVERMYPDAFDFLRDGWGFLLMMACLFFLYYYIISPRVDKLLPNSTLVRFTNGQENQLTQTGEQFDYGAWVHNLGKKVWSVPKQIAQGITKGMSD